MSIPTALTAAPAAFLLAAVLRASSFLLACFLLASALVAAVPAAEADDSVELLAIEALAPWTGDLDGIEQRGFIRVAIPHNPLFLAYQGEEAVGLAAERMRELERFLTKRTGSRIGVMVMPTARDELIPALIGGRADLVDANLTVIGDREELIAFSDPIRDSVEELVITGPGAPEVESFDDLVATGLFLRPSSSYFAHVAALNQARSTAGKPPIPIRAVNELLEDNDLIEMVEVGLIPAIVMDDHKARLWAQEFGSVTIHETLSVNQGGRTALGFRKDSSKLKAALDDFVATIRTGSLLGNIFDKRYLKSSRWIENLDLEDDSETEKEVVGLIRKYAERYGIDWTLIVAQAFQESRLDQAKTSEAGAVGVMQILPSTAGDPSVGIPDITTPENNVHAGIRYLTNLRETYFDDPDIRDLDRVLLSLAAYNAGPGNIRKARRRAKKMGLDPNRWFNHVEVATQKAVSGEPVIYVRNIFRYAVSLRLRQEIAGEVEEARRAIEKGTAPGQD